MVDYFKDEGIAKDFKQKLVEYPDTEILKILKKRDHYNKVAVQLAIEEAIGRGLINSEQDLLGKEFNVEPMPNRIFPPIEKKQTRIKVIRSIARAFILVGIIPIVFAVLGILRNELIESGILLILGVIWLINSFLLMNKQKAQSVNLLMVIAFAFILYSGRFFLVLKSVQVMDVAFSIAFYILIFYGLLYTKRLLT